MVHKSVTEWMGGLKRKRDEAGHAKAIENVSREGMTAFVKCRGTCTKKCSYGCLGCGACIRVCEHGGISMVDNVAVTDKEKCTGCGTCIAACPQHLIELVPYNARYLVQCSSHEKGLAVKVKCRNGCLGCGLCARRCEEKAIRMVDHLAVVDYGKCRGCGRCAAGCPAGAVVLG